MSNSKARISKAHSALERQLNIFRFVQIINWGKGSVDMLKHVYEDRSLPMVVFFFFFLSSNN